LITFAQELLTGIDLAAGAFGRPAHLGGLARVMELTNQARGEQTLDRSLLNRDLIERYRQAVGSHPVTSRGTTHISVIDELGNAAALTLSNGEGCGHVLPGTGIMLNNMLGEEDLNPLGFHAWPEDVRVSSMMAPCVAQGRLADGRAEQLIAIGSGGSNRLRTAILQTLSNLIDFGMSVEDAVAAPRIHLERGLVSIEPGFPEAAVTALSKGYPQYHLWDEINLFFGGTHTVMFDGLDFSGAGDPRRGGAYLETL
jgi:gamma-glutamyltranspeptidase/glutathione hydrolase